MQMLPHGVSDAIPAFSFSLIPGHSPPLLIMLASVVGFLFLQIPRFFHTSGPWHVPFPVRNVHLSSLHLVPFSLSFSQN